MSTRSSTRAATASTSKDASATPVKTEQKQKGRTRKTAQSVPSESDQQKKENVKGKVLSKTPSKTPSRTPPAKKSSKPASPAYCTCKKGDDGTPMVQCGECQGWYHFRCVELKEEDAEDITVYICPSCLTTTGRRTTMTWEGPEAFEDTEPPAAKKQPAAKRIKRDSPLPEPLSESDEDPSSEDEYVAEDSKAKSKGVGKRQTRRISSSSESDSEVSDDAKPRRHRIRKRSGSPPQNALKRKSAPTSHAHPPKRNKSDAVLPTDDPTRKYCLGKLEELFRDVFLRYPHVRVESEGGETSIVQKPVEDLTEDERAALVDESKEFADELERCVFEIYSEPDKLNQPSAGSKYKDRFRMLQFNLSKPDRVVIHQRITNAEITPKEISLMSSTDLANEETKQSIKIAEKEALEHSILTPTAVPRAKITHKGLEELENVRGEPSTRRDGELALMEEERRERERMARLRVQTTERTASVSVPPESPLIAQQPCGGPPPVTLHTTTPTDALRSPPSPSAVASEKSPIPITPSSPAQPEVAEPELNLAEFINMEEEVDGPSQAPSETFPSPPPAVQPVVAGAPAPQSPAPQPDPSSISSTGLSPFAPKSEEPRPGSFDLNALWNTPRKEDSVHPAVSSSPQEPVMITSSPQVTALDKDIVVDTEEIGADDQDFDMFLEDKDSAQTSAEAQQAALAASPAVWTGKINMPLDSTIPQETPVVARQVGGRPLGNDSALWKTLFPSELLRIDGRVPVENSGKFLLQMRMNAAKELIAVAFSPASESSDVGFRILSDFLIAKGRHGLVFPWGNRPKDHHPGRELYIIPLLSDSPLPDYMELLDDLRLPRLRKANLLIGIWVLAKGKLAPPPAPPAAPAIPSLPQPQSRPDVQLPLQSTPPPPFPPATSAPPAPSMPATLAAEFATLSPEQIQLMIQTLTANATLPLPPAQPQLQRTPPPGQARPPTLMPPQPHVPYHTPPPPQAWGNQGQGYGPMYPPPAAPANPPMPPPTHTQPPPLSWDRPSEPYLRHGHDRDDRGGRGWRGGRGRGRGRTSDIPQKPVDSGWPRRPPRYDNSAPGPSSPTRRW
ncbi:putative PHD-finger [Lyophyllum shimeji]|uniref:Transcription factor BYE1 n=1 Tax=Lyophyllum shimeji TaxID=47721 RepID=A0A9P3PVD4_LYOSH|nr:putative PHD-finger [Lyophyllum shimeji]